MLIGTGLGTTSSVLFLQLLGANTKPRNWDEISAVSHMSVRTAKSAFAHLESHGWIIRDGRDWRLEAGLDCDCPKRPRRPRGKIRPDLENLGGRVALYRLFNAENVLLYVGITDNLRIRMSRHAAEQDWWPEVTRRTVALYDDRESADRAETLAIAAEKPLHNKAKVYAPKAAVEFSF